jgi:iron complex outermembrane receptor protein
MRWIALGLLLPSLGWAQESDDAVVVTATRVDRPSLEVPASIDRVRAEDIQAMRPQINLSESLSRVPGIVVQNRQNYAQDLQISSRGFGARSTFGVRGLRLLVDGIPASMPDGQGQVSHIDLGSAERIEVLRGPFSVMHGNASGGVINVISGSGARNPGLDVDLLTGSYGTSRAALRAGGLTNGLDWIGSAAYFETDGYREHSTARRTQVNGRLGYTTEGGTAVRLVGNALTTPAQDPLGLTRAQFESNPRSVVPQALLFDTRKTVRQAQSGVTLEHAFGDLRLEATGYYGERVLRQYLAFTGVGPTSSGGVVDLDRNFGGGSLRLTGDTRLLDRPLTLVAGAEFERQDERRRGFVNDFGSLGALRRDENDRAESSGAYLQAEWRFAENWIGVAGLRTSRVTFRSSDLYITTLNPDDSGSVRYHATTPAIGVVYRVTPAASVYANYGRGFETPTFSELAYRPGGPGLNFNLQASKSRHAELGTKLVLPSGARINAALFDVATKNEIVVDTAIGGRTTYQNAGRTTRRGFELGVDAPLGAGFEATLAWTLLDATFRDSFTTQNGTETVPAGNRLPAVPRNYLYAELRWRHEPSGFAAALELQSKSRVAVDDVNSEFAGSWTTANLALGFTQQGKDWSFSEFVRVDNVTDEHYAGSVIVNDGNGRYYEPAPGTNVLVGLRGRLAF